MIADEYQVRLLRKSATRANLAADLIHRGESRSARLRLQELAHDLRREAHELEDLIIARTRDSAADHLRKAKLAQARADVCGQVADILEKI